MRNIQLVSVMAFLCVLCLGVGFINTAHAQVLKTTDTVVIVDANGNIVGPAFERIDGIQTHLVFYTDPFVVPVTVRQNRIFGNRNPQFESTDCTGNPVINAQGNFNTLLATPSTVVSPIIPGRLCWENYTCLIPMIRRT